MNSFLALSFALSVIVAVVDSQQGETCGLFRQRRCQETECCLFRILGVCRPLRRENQSCGIFTCGCEPGLECVRNRRGRYMCAASTSVSTTTSPTDFNITTPLTSISSSTFSTNGTTTELTTEISTDVSTDTTTVA